jgi:hypothetical protein
LADLMSSVPVSSLAVLALAASLLEGCSPRQIEATQPSPPPLVAEPALPEIDTKLLKKPAAPQCQVAKPAVTNGGSAAPEQLADPNLLEIARLELERDCYKAAEQSSRKRLERLQRVIRGRQ